MTKPEPIHKLQLAALICAVLLLLNGVSAPRLAAALETASFRLSLSINGDAVRFRTGSSDNGQSGLNLDLIFERRS